MPLREQADAGAPLVGTDPDDPAAQAIRLEDAALAAPVRHPDSGFLVIAFALAPALKHRDLLPVRDRVGQGDQLQLGMLRRGKPDHLAAAPETLVHPDDDRHPRHDHLGPLLVHLVRDVAGRRVVQELLPGLRA